MHSLTLTSVFDRSDREELFKSVSPEKLESQSIDFKNPHLVDLLVIYDGGFPVARFGLYDNPSLYFEESKAITIGLIYCNDLTFSKYLFDEAKRFASLRNGQILIGPMEGSTWDKYRVNATEEGSSFFLDVNAQRSLVELFQLNGFVSIADYQTNIIEDLDYNGDLETMALYYKKKGGQIRHIDLNDRAEEFRRIATFCNLAFANNLLFTPTNEERFVEKYSALASFINEEYVWIVENKDEEIEAIVFGILDPNDDQTLILKTIAVKPHSKYKGIATYLSRKLILIAKANGVKRIVHALFIKDNLSNKASQRLNARLLKEYSLFGIKLQNNG